MPELPEVQTVIDTLKPLIVSHRISAVKVNYPRIIETDLDSFKSCVINKQILDLHRYGKFIMVELSAGFLVIHLRMEGKFYVVEGDSEWMHHKHSHVIFRLDDNRYWIYHDVRKFGRIAYVDVLDCHPGLRRLGLDVFDKTLDSHYVCKQAENRSIAIKTFLLDQSVIAGIGNIYANEILFDAGISPFQPANTLKLTECKTLINSTRKIMSLALKQGGTTIRSYTSSLGVTGMFQQSLLVHGKEGLSCPRCDSLIIREKINGRSCFYCQHCQKLRQRKGRRT